MRTFHVTVTGSPYRGSARKRMELHVKDSLQHLLASQDQQTKTAESDQTDQPANEVAPEPVSGTEVTVYTMPNCVGCRATKRALDKGGVDYSVIDLTDRPDLVEQFRAEGFRSLPIVEDAKGTRTAGFSPDRIRAIVAVAQPADPGVAALKDSTELAPRAVSSTARRAATR